MSATFLNFSEKTISIQIPPDTAAKTSKINIEGSYRNFAIRKNDKTPQNPKAHIIVQMKCI